MVLSNKQIPYTPQDAARNISHGHAARKLSGRNRTWGALKINSPQDLEKHVESTLESENTKCFRRSDGTDIYFNADTNTIVACNPEHRDWGTVFRDSEEYYERQKSQDRDYRDEHNLDHQKEYEGGYPALYESEIEHGLDKESEQEICYTDITEVYGYSSSSSTQEKELTQEKQEREEVDITDIFGTRDSGSRDRDIGNERD